MKHREKIRLFEPNVPNLLLAGCIVLCNALSIASSFLLGNFIDFLSGRPNFDRATVLYLGAILGALLIAAVMNMFFAQFLPLKRLLKKSIDYSQDVMSDVLKLSQKNYQSKEKGYYINLVTSSAYTCGDIYAMMNIELVGNVMCVLLMIAVAAYINVFFALTYIVYIPLFAFLTQSPNKKLTAFQKAGLSTQDAFLSGTKKIVEDKRAINIARAEAYFEELYKKSSEKYLSFITKFKWYSILSTNMPTLLSAVLTAATLGIAAKLYFGKGSTIGMIFVVFQLSQVLQKPLNGCMEIIIYCSLNQAHAERIRELRMQTQDDSGFDKIYRELDHLADIPSGELFSSPDRERKLFSIKEFTLPKNQLIVIKGGNGAGKSTLANLLTGFADRNAFDGSIALDDALADASYFSHPILFTDGDVKENMFGKEINPAVFDVLGISFSDKKINESGSNLSLGEQQKLGLLRVLSSDAEVIVLDEPFANLDRESINRLAAYLSKLKRRKSILAIVHSPELDAFADVLIRIHNGELVCECG